VTRLQLVETIAQAIGADPLSAAWPALHAKVSAHLGDTNPNRRSLAHDALLTEAWACLRDRDVLAYLTARAIVMADLQILAQASFVQRVAIASA